MTDEHETTAPDPVRVCKRCSTQTQTSADQCPYCGAPYVKRRRKLGKRGKRVLAALLILALAGGVTAGVIAKQRHDDRIAEEKAEAKRAEQSRRAAERAAEEEAEEQAALDEIQRDVRRDSINQMRRSITKDARKRVAEGFLDGPIYGTQCDPVGGGSVSNLDAKTTKFECLAVTTKNGDGTVEGYRFSATMNWDEASWTWRLGD